METIITLILGLVLVFGPKLLGRILKQPDPKATPPAAEVEEDWIPGPADFDEKLQNSEAKIPNQSKYFTYETIGDESNYAHSPVQNPSDVESQVFENEHKKWVDLTLSEEEVYKGIIYSEILKNKV
ncbi:MAG: hypothetical protein MJZ57_06130 [Bacteroidales bacterium]|nr:hypothetical protein [Bacteroidales bacterium]